MRRHILSRPTWRLLSGRVQRLSLPFALCFYPHSLGELTLLVARCTMRSVFSVNLRRCDLPIGLSFRVDQVRIAQSPLEIRSAIGQAVACATLPWGRCRAGIFTSSLSLSLSLGSLLHRGFLSSLSRLLLLAPMGVVEWLVDLSGHPQAVQEHRELSRHRHCRSFLSVLASASCDLLSMTS